MLAYIAIVAVMNLLLGMVVARMLAPARAGRKSAPRNREPLPTESSAETLQGSGEEEDDVASGGEPSRETDSASATTDSATDGNDVIVETLATIANELQELSKDVETCRTVGDTQLLRATVEKMRTMSTAWREQCEQGAHTEQPDEDTLPIQPGPPATAIEALVSQIRTTLSQIDEIDLESPLESVVDALQREIESLDSLQKTIVESFAASSTAVA